MAEYSTTITTYVIRNIDYSAISVKIRLEDKGDPDTISFNPGESLTFDVSYSGDEATFYYHHDGDDYKVQQIDLNDDHSSDDLNTPNQDHNDHNTLRYARGDGATDGGDLDLINFTSKTYETDFKDGDGVDGGVKAAFQQTVDGSVMTLELSKN